MWLNEQVSAYFDVAGEARNVLVVAAEGGGTAARIPISACGAGRTVTCDVLGPGGGVLDLAHQLTGMSTAALLQLHETGSARLVARHQLGAI